MKRVAALALLAGCAGSQSATDPAGPQAQRVATLFWWMLIVAGVVYVIVIAALLWATWRGRRRAAPEVPASPADNRARRVVVGATAITIVILLAFLVGSVFTGQRLTAAPTSGTLPIRVIGHQWWWEVVYPDSIPQDQIETANEIHIPVGEPVVIAFDSRDVIHSFWVPNLNGKRDLIPGYKTSLWLRADRPGVFRGQCAEFCGHEHAKMAIAIVAEPPAKFESWRAKQRQAQLPPSDSVAKRGEQVFLARDCVMCHAIAGTPAGGRVGPDLTHLASRATIAAGTLPNTPGNLGGWIVDPQRIKPGADMPPNQLAPQDLQALLTYLETLK